jgi:methylated-DNA-protein-cysteine methyltransferase-like protein
VSSDSHQRIYEAVRQIPKGRVATYGQIASVAGLGRHARLVGYALNVCDDDLPWHRVINARGEISERSDPSGGGLQRDRLLEEGVGFDDRGRVSLARFQWKSPDPLDDPDW